MTFDRIILVGCAQTKALPPALNDQGPKLPAKDLYVSPLFRKRRAYAEREVAEGRAELWAILSALHKVISPERELRGYDTAISDWRTGELDFWGSQVAISLQRDVVCGGRFCERRSFESTEQAGYVRCSGCLDGSTIEVHAGASYVEPARPYLEALGAIVETPLVGLGIGEQLRWYTLELNPQLTIGEAA